MGSRKMRELLPHAALSSAFFALGAFAGCGGSATTARSSVEVSFQVQKNGAALACSAVSEISSVTVTVYGSDGLTLRAGFPKKVDCAAGHFTLDLPTGGHQVEIAASGPLAGDPSAVLFRARASIETPADTTLALTLQPEVAYLSVSWSFQGAALSPCSTEVSEVEVLVSAGSTQATSFHRRVACSATPIVIDQPLPLLGFTIQIDGYSAQEFVVFSGTVQRTLARGDNTVEVTLSPMGGQLYLDWTFAVGDQTVRACDDPRVAVTDVRARVRSVEGGPEATDVISCGAARPYAFTEQRYRQGRMLEVELRSDGAARFLGRQSITMPSGDYHGGILVLEPVGTATVSIEVSTSTCADLLRFAESFDVKIAAGEGMDPLVHQTVPPRGGAHVAVTDLPYGDYVVDVAELKNDGTPLCSVHERRSITARDNTWAPFVL